MSRVDFSQEWRIVGAQHTNPVGDYAVTELRRALEKITGESPIITTRFREGLPSIVLRYGKDGGDGFSWEAKKDLIEISGESPRALLFGVYDFLEALGCSWIKPGLEGERLPSGAAFELADKKVSQTPVFTDRALIFGDPLFMNEIEDWLRWAIRNRINTLFFHTTDNELSMGAVPESQYQRLKGTITRMTGQRGFTIEHGGHGLAALLPRKLFSQMPEAFRMKDGARTPDHNFCVHHPEGMKIIRGNAARYFESHPEVDIFHLWPDDIVDGGWCECDLCVDFSASDQALIVTNALAEELATIHPKARISFLAYHDTEKAPAKIKPRANVALLWAPRLRSYAQAIDATNPAVNTHYPATVKDVVSVFKEAEAQNARVFEYYLDTVLFKSAVPPLPSVMKNDLLFYRGAGAEAVGVLMTGSRPFFTAELNAYLFTRLAWNPDQDLLTLIKGFYRAASGGESPALLAYLRALEKAFALALDFHPACALPTLKINDVLANPPIDMGDPYLTPPEALAEKVKTNAAIEKLLVEAEKSLTEAEATLRTRGIANNDAFWAGEAKELALNKLWLTFDLARLRLYQALRDEPFQPAALVEAEKALTDFLAFCEAEIADPILRARTLLLHRAFWGLRLDRIRLDHQLKGLGAFVYKIKTLWRLARLRSRVKGAYK